MWNYANETQFKEGRWSEDYEKKDLLYDWCGKAEDGRQATSLRVDQGQYIENYIRDHHASCAYAATSKWED